MTTIAYDGKTLAVDRRVTRGGLYGTTTKAFKLETGAVMAFCGSMAHAMTLKRWYLAGTDPATYPDFQKDEEKNTFMIVADRGVVKVYEQTPDPIFIQDRMMAWGSGRDFALGAMACGKTAAESIEVASQFDPGTGGGVDAFGIGQ